MATHLTTNPPLIYALQLAASIGLISVVVRLLEGGYNVDEKDGYKSTSLYCVCLNGDLDVV